jgi:hypothetical protein
LDTYWEGLWLSGKTPGFEKSNTRFLFKPGFFSKPGVSKFHMCVD